ncbi:MAG TPA: ABC transporter ATP-binding protein [Candidatus Sulfotelmatobacter sp.]|nr:ABC transporter ATP-binding protein [Candidatus Sulfotelmatobacter sp.]
MNEKGKGLAIASEGLVRRHANGGGFGPLDLEVRRGEAFAIMGPNGAGKSTLLHVLATITRPQEGAIRWFDAADRSAIRRRLGVALDALEEDEQLTGRQCAYFWSRQWLSDRVVARELSDQALVRFGLQDSADDCVRTYSFGMRRRLALVEALGHHPTLALLDEPTAGLDPQGVDTLAAELSARSQQGMTTVVASNDPTFVQSACHRVALLREGRVVACSAPSELLSTLAGTRVAELVLHENGVADRLAAIQGVIGVHALAGAIRVRFDDPESLPQIVRSADSPGGNLVTLTVREADLRDCLEESVRP